MKKKVWFVTGTSTGLGKELVKYLVQQKCNVVATARNIATIKEYLPNWQALDNLLLLTLDITDPHQIKNAVQKSLEKWHTIDVLVNNAGYAYFSPVEGAAENEIAAMFKVNLWGVKKMLDAILPIMRQHKSGHILNVSSLGGLRAFAGFGYYHASKFALEGLSESLSLEVAPLGIQVTLVEPGDFKTDFASRSAKENPKPLADYAATAGQNIANLKKLSGNQPGNPAKAAKIIYALTEETSKAPLHLLLGQDAYIRALEKLQAMQDSFNENYALTIQTDD